MMRQITLSLALIGLTLASPIPTGAQAPGSPVLFAPASYLGVGIMEVSPDRARVIGLVDPHGVEISSVDRDSPARRAGLERGDIVLTYRDERVNGIEHFARLVRETPAGGNVELGVVRGQDRMEVEVEIGRRDPAASVRESIRAVRERFALDDRDMESLRQHLDSLRQHLDSVHQRLRSEQPGSGAEFGTPMRRIADRRVGFEVVDVDGQLAEFLDVECGALVRSVLEGSPAHEAGIRAGDVIVGLDGRVVGGTADIRETVLALGAGGHADLNLVREGESLSLRITVPRPSDRPPARPVSE